MNLLRERLQDTKEKAMTKGDEGSHQKLTGGKKIRGQHELELVINKKVPLKVRRRDLTL